MRIATIIAVALLAAAPAILDGLPPGHDHALHLTWYTHFATQLWDGDPRPRWLFTMNAGFGSPTFFYYGPTPYYITAALRPLFAEAGKRVGGAGDASTADAKDSAARSSDPAGWRQLGLSAALALVLSGVGAYFWLRSATGARGGGAALGGAIAYTILPYHLAADLYARAAFAEFWALAWVPWVLYFAKRCTAGVSGAEGAEGTAGFAPDRGGAMRGRAPLVGLAAATALLVTTHLPTTLIILSVPVLEALAASAPGRRAAAARRVLAGILLGAALSAAYWLPALANQDEVRTQIPATDPRHYARNFLFEGAGSDRPFADFTRALEAMTFLTAAAAAAAAIGAAVGAGVGAGRRAALFWGVVSAAAIAMMTPLARPVWGLLPVLQTIQFPWRFNVVLAVAAAATCALAAGAAAGPGRSGGTHRAARAGRIARAAPTLVLLAISIALDWNAIRDSAVARRAIEPSFTLMTVAAGMDNKDLRPRTARFEMFEGASLATLAARADRVHVVSGSGTAGIAGWGPRDIRVRTDSTDEMLVVLDQLYFPGWRARLVPGGERVEVQPDPQWGLAMLRVPAGRREVALAPTGGAADAWGAALSTLAAVALGVIAVTCLSPPSRPAKASSGSPRSREGRG